MKTELLLGSLFLLPFYCLSQAAVDKAASRVDSVNRYATTANATAANITTTAATIKSTASTLAELPGIFGIKKKAKNAQPTKEAPDNTAPAAASASNSTATAFSGTTIINFTGADYDKLAMIKERVKNCSSVTDAKMKFGGSSSSVITVTHKGSTEDLFALMKEACKDLIKASNLMALDEGKIDIKL